jgi:hypothetical protein
MRPDRRLTPAVGLAAAGLVLFSSFGGTAGAELEPRTVRAYEVYSARITAQFRERVRTPEFLWATADADRKQALGEGEIVVAAGDGDGILDVPGGLIHHWIAAVFLPGVRIGQVLDRERRYDEYPRIHKPVLESEFFGRHGQIDRVRLRLEQRTRFVHAVLDTWWQRAHEYPAPDRAYVISTAERIQQVQNAGEPDERRLPIGKGGGYLWHANTYMKMLERDGGTYLEFQTLGLSRGFPRFLGWLAEPIVRRVGRGSVERTLDELRASFQSESDARSTAPAE